MRIKIFQNDNSKYKIIYIVGPGRSGSTILEILLSNGKSAFGSGELTQIVDDGFIKNKKCSCGKNFKECEIWRKLTKKMNFSDKTIKIWKEIQRKIDWHTGFIRQILNLISQKEWNIYKDLNRELFSSVHEITNARFIIDSSKYAGRALALWKIFKDDIFFICLIRSPEGLMSSFQKPNKDEQLPKKPFQVFVYYSFVMLSLKIISFLIPKSQFLCIHYEDLIHSPVKVLSCIEKFCGLNLEKTKEKLKNNEYFDVGHIVSGNRIRKLGMVKFNPSLGKPTVNNTKEKIFLYCMKIVKIVSFI